MTPTTAIEPTPAEQRRQKAQTALKEIKAEETQVHARLKTAEATVIRLNELIVAAQRSGDAELLASLRDERREAQESVSDFQRALPKIAREIELGEGELHAANVMVQSVEYNKLQTQQLELLQTITAAISTITKAVSEKTRLAVRQDRILASVRPHGNLSPEGIRHELAHAITALLQGVPLPKPLGELDWSSWKMTDQGDLLRS